jgi:hypothetical protein
MADASTWTYHVDIWTDPPTYVCQLCVPAEACRGTVVEVTQHLQDVHQAAAIPSPSMDALLALRSASAPQDPAPLAPTPSPEEASHG